MPRTIKDGLPYTQATGEVRMGNAEIVLFIDGALERFADRDLVPAGEVLDLLLDLRSCISADAALAALIESEATPAGR